MLLQGAITPEKVNDALEQKISEEDAFKLVSVIRNGCLRERNYALSILAHFRGMPIRRISKLLAINRNTVTEAIKRYCNGDVDELFISRKNSNSPKYKLPEYKEALFKILHSPPRDHGINRTTWTMKDLHLVMADEGFSIAMASIRLILKEAGFRFKKAKKVLTSTDPNYRKKLEAITEILSKLGGNERFFSIDEFGPVAIKIHGGKALTGPGQERTVPQIQKNKGRVLLVAALELSTNQITHFYANRKSTTEMIQLMHILLSQYSECRRIYFSWDAASWHVSKRFLSEVDRINTKDYRAENNTPEIAIAPLPSCAQFLNVIESVFSGMARAIIHNSDYESVDECKKAINLYFAERNQHFKDHPKRAGNKIWGKERTPPVFSETNNCKDPIYR
ncbi:MAG: IS630 family transposase [Desulfobacterales bacterium]|nr:IS630 family transposase [Desulfobacterales bacterium]